MEVVGEVCERRAELILLSATATFLPARRALLDGGLKCPRARHLFSVCRSPFKPNLSSLHCYVKAGWRRGDIPVASFIFRRCRCSRAKRSREKKGPFFCCLRYRTICSAMCCCFGCLFIVCTVGKVRKPFFFFSETFMITKVKFSNGPGCLIVRRQTNR